MELEGKTEGMPDQGLQVVRYAWDNDGMMQSTHGNWVRLSIAEKFHDQLQEQIGKNLKLETDKMVLADALGLHCIICMKMTGFGKEHCESCVTTKALKTTGMEISE